MLSFSFFLYIRFKGNLKGLFTVLSDDLECCKDLKIQTHNGYPFI